MESDDVIFPSNIVDAANKCLLKCLEPANENRTPLEHECFDKFVKLIDAYRRFFGNSQTFHELNLSKFGAVFDRKIEQSHPKK